MKKNTYTRHDSQCSGAQRRPVLPQCCVHWPPKQPEVQGKIIPWRLKLICLQSRCLSCNFITRTSEWFHKNSTAHELASQPWQLSHHGAKNKFLIIHTRFNDAQLEVPCIPLLKNQVFAWEKKHFFAGGVPAGDSTRQAIRLSSQFGVS